ncbi:hypothetical protein C4587_03075 [Candidatus Parcubacteria bacterium]|nr:MAG: hypothetical protein C4587_03075 [Candidatus Parcubacteria bacterium]
MKILKSFFVGIAIAAYVFGAQALALWVSITRFGGNRDGAILVGICASAAGAALTASFAAPRLIAALREAVIRNFFRNLFWRPGA